jgi:hypothetical protein
MALVISQAAKLKPVVRLSQALEAFQSALNDEQRQLFLANSDPPSSTAAIAFVAELDERKSEHRGKCIGFRFLNFLSSIQQFTSIIDIALNELPALPGLVWSAFKIALSFAQTFTSYFERLSTLVMEIGRECPLLNAFGQVYPSPKLQEMLLEYYIVVVRFAEQAIRFHKHSGMSSRF